MRLLFILQGLPASGKSSFIRRHGLQDHALSYDSMREMFSISAHDYNGAAVMSIRKGVQTTLVKAVHEAARYRMSNGDTLFIDNTNTSRNAIKPWLALAREFDYTPYILRFGHKESMGTMMERDSFRPFRDHVGEETIRRMASQLSGYEPHPDVEHVYENHWEFVQDKISTPIVDLTDKKEVVVVGDIQGCGNALQNLIDKIGPLQDKSRHWVFVGDLFDRGPTPEKVFDLLWPYPQDNITIVEGNHERSVRQTLMGTREFKQSKETTIDRIPEEKHKSLLKLVSRPKTVFSFKYGNNLNIVTHAGINLNILKGISEDEKIIRNVGLNSDYDYYIGGGERGKMYFNIGTYENFMEPLQKSHGFRPNIRQFFGHRNDYDQDVETPNRLFPSLFPLESKVELGGVLSAVRISLDGSYSYEYAKEQ